MGRCATHRSRLMNGSKKIPAIALGLALVTAALYWPAISHPFINFDDPLYVSENARVQKGLTWDNVVWAFATIHGEDTYWHPLTWLSHMLDSQLWGAGPHPAHLVNLLLHLANILLFFQLLLRLTGRVWPCAAAAALFAWHPLQVDTVAWIAERKNLLSTLFTLGSLLFYQRYATGRSRKAYFGALLSFALALLAKPAVVVLPFLFLLLDFWPLQRFQRNSGRPGVNPPPRSTASLLLEKVPFLLLALFSGIITIVGHEQMASLGSRSAYPLPLRLENALVSIALYLKKMAWPADLAIYYPYPSSVALWKVALGGILLVGLSLLAWRARRSRPYWFVGWFWFLIGLAPVLGIIQAGSQAMADRFVYLPLMGLGIALVWTGASVRPEKFSWLVAGLAAVCLACLVMTRIQLRYWESSLTLFSHALSVTRNNPIAHLNYGAALVQEGRSDEALEHFRETLRLSPANAEAQYNLGVLAARKGNANEAIAYYRAAIQAKPGYARAHFNLGNAFFRTGNFREAAEAYRAYIALRPDDPEGHNNLGTALSRAGQTDEAMAAFQRSVAVDPTFTEARFNLALAALQNGDPNFAAQQFGEILSRNPSHSQSRYQLAVLFASDGQYARAISELRAALAGKPDLIGAVHLLARLRATTPDEKLRDGKEAVLLAERAAAGTGSQNPFYLDTLAAAYAESGRFPEAREAAARALEIAQRLQNPGLAAAIKKHQELFAANQPFHEAR